MCSSDLTAEIADMFGESELVIKRRLKLALVSPRLFELFERNEINFEQMQAFTVTDDHAKQEAAYFDAPTQYAHDIKRRLTEGAHGTDHWLMRFVGLENFKAAGGEVKQDLFAREEGDGHFSDMALLEKLAFEKLERAADAERAAGWKWVETALQFNYSAAEKFGRVYPAPLPLSEAQIAALEALEAKAEEVNNELEAAEEDEELYEEFLRLEQEIASLKSAAGEAYEPEEMAIAGVVVAINGSSIKIERGCVKPGADLKALKERQRQAENAGEVTAEGVIPQKGSGKRADGLSQAMVANLTAHRTMALRAALMDRADVALIAVTHRLVTLAFYRQASAYGEGQIPETALVLAGADYL